eukprot:7856641-Alexandrium_andersonii.AAC.1
MCIRDRGSEAAKSRSRRLQSAILQSAIRAILCYWRESSQIEIPMSSALDGYVTLGAAARCAPMPLFESTLAACPRPSRGSCERDS